jgi:hypothetical protein
LVLFNRFYQPDLDLDELDVVPRATISTSEALRLPLRWIAILYGRVSADLACTSGVHTAQDVLKALMAGACVTMMASELLLNGIGKVRTVREAVVAWMRSTIRVGDAERGSMSQRNVAFRLLLSAPIVRIVSSPARHHHTRSARERPSAIASGARPRGGAGQSSTQTRDHPRARRPPGRPPSSPPQGIPTLRRQGYA